MDLEFRRYPQANPVKKSLASQNFHVLQDSPTLLYLNLAKGWRLASIGFGIQKIPTCKSSKKQNAWHPKISMFFKILLDYYKWGENEYGKGREGQQMTLEKWNSRPLE